MSGKKRLPGGALIKSRHEIAHGDDLAARYHEVQRLRKQVNELEKLAEQNVSAVRDDTNEKRTG